MKPAPFQYWAPDRLGEALELLAEHGYDAKPLAGGQSLVPMLNLRLARPAVLVDLNRIAELRDMELGGERLTLGALTRHQTLVDDPVVGGRVPALKEAARYIGHLAIRMRGTLGGSLAHADPAAELPMLAAALEARIRIASVRGERWMAARDFFQGVFTTALAPDELVVAVEWPRLDRPGVGSAVEEFSLRTGDFALAAVAVRVEVDTTGQVTRLGLALAGVGPGPVVATAAEHGASGLVGETAVVELADVIPHAIEPVDDLHASAAYRRHLARVLARRALGRAYREACRGHGDGGGEA
jgi:carbon-monoxide dehydrogenase medium subunit